MSTLSVGGGAWQLKKQPDYSTRHRYMLPCPGQMRYATHFHKLGHTHQQCTCCENQWEAGWPKLNQKSVSYLATWQHGNVKSMPYNARHIPGPDARQWCHSGSATSPHSANQSSLAFSPPLRLSAVFPFLAPKKQRGDQVRKRCHDQNGRVTSHQKITLTLLAVGPSAEEGLRHVNMTRRETSSCRAC